MTESMVEGPGQGQGEDYHWDRIDLEHSNGATANRRFFERLGPWVFMDNHIHFLFKSGKAGVSTSCENF
jgi:hypothetical protein